MPTPTVIDVSHWNDVVDLSKASADGIRGLIHKASEGTSYADPDMKERFRMAKDAGLLWGLYHFLRPGNMDDQVEHLVKTSVGAWDGNTVVACDYEDPMIPLSDVEYFMAKCATEFHVDPVLYSGHVLKEKLTVSNHPLTKYRLWLAHYTTKAAPILPKGWTKYWLWQYTDKGKVAGINGNVDLNDYQGPDLARDWARIEEPPIATVKVIAPKGVKVEVEYS